MVDILISIDTTKAAVAKAAIEAGADIINDISGFKIDPAMKQVAIDTKAGCMLAPWPHHRLCNNFRVR